MSQVLDEFLEKTRLLDEDRTLLHRRRGFDDELIGNLHFRSACPENEKIILSLLAKYGQSVCADAGLLYIKNNRPLATKKLIDRNIIIPYLEEGTCVAVRPHKNFIKGRSLSVYYANEDYSEDATTVLCEGEFKAAAAAAYGYQAIAIPGISSFVGDKHAGRKFLEFYEDIVLRGVREVIILFDNEEKGDPDLPKYKEDASKRYDVQYFAHLMCMKLNEWGGDIEAFISWIPDKYRDSEGKADIDGMLATGVKEDEFEEILNNRLDADEFLDTLSNEANDVIRGKLARREDRVNFVIRNGCYYIKFINPKDQKIEEQQVSNFTMKFLSAELDQDEGVLYEMEVTNDKKQSTVIKFIGADWADYKKFRRTLSTYGKFNWSSSGKVLDMLFLEVIPDDMKIVESITEVGYDEKQKVYFFDNCILGLDGSLVTPDSDDVIEFNGKFYRINKKTSRPSIIFLPSARADGWSLEDIRDIANRLRVNYNTIAIYDVVSWMIAAVYKPWLFPINRTFPLLGVFGRKNCGKTRLLQWLLSFFYDNPEPIAFDSSTKPGLRNQAAELKYLPLWLDEFRNNQKGKSYLDMLRGIYDHNQVIMSSNKVGQNKAFKFRSSLILSGEHIPADETGALNQRLITIQLPDKPDGSQFGWFETQYQSFGGVFKFLLSKREKYVEQIKAEYFQRLETYRKLPNVEQRIAINYALIHGISKVILGVDENMLSVGIGEVAYDSIEDDLNTDPITNMLLSCMQYSKSKSLINTTEQAIDVKCDSHDFHKISIHFNLKRCVSLYNEILKKMGRTAIEVNQLRRSLKEHPWVSNDNKMVRINGRVMRCYSVNLEQAPEEVLTSSYNFADEKVKNDINRVFGGENSVMPREEEHYEDFTDGLP